MASRVLYPSYSSFQIAVHWAVFLMVVLNVLLGQQVERIYEAVMAGEAPETLGPIWAHASIGVFVLILMLLRLNVRLHRPTVEWPEPNAALSLLAKANHWSFYGVLILIPVLGAVAWFGRQEWAGELHGLLVWVLFALLALHLAGVVFHGLVLRDRMIRRMVPPSDQEDGEPSPLAAVPADLPPTSLEHVAPRNR